jgi:predicted phosphoribosyltransferase
MREHLSDILDRNKDGFSNLILLGIPRGAVPMVKKIANSLGVDWDILLVHKVSSPEAPEYALGAVTESGIWVGFEGHKPPIPLIQGELNRLHERSRQYRILRKARDLSGKTVCIVDDGIATGWTVLAAVREARALGARAVWITAPVIAPSSVPRLSREVDRWFVLSAPEDFRSVGQYYDDFSAIEDGEVASILRSEP